jgi:hypothetical protein
MERMEIKTLLRNLELGSSVAEFDQALDRYFVETEAFRALVFDQADIISGEKGTGKSALYRVFSRRYANIPELKKVEVVSGFNPAGNPVFQRLGTVQTLTESQYISIWKSYLLSLVGNWLLQVYESNFTSKMTELDGLLRRVGLRTEDDSPETIFSKLFNKIKYWMTPKSAQLDFTWSESGIPVISPKLEFQPTETIDETNEVIPHEIALKLLNDTLQEVDLTIWVVLDRLDEAFPGSPASEIPILRALLRTYLDLLAYPRLKLKLFVRNDLFRKIIQGGFVNLTHVNARKIEIIWDEDDLLNLFSRRVRESLTFSTALQIEGLSDKEIFERIFPDQVIQGSRRPTTWVWMMSRIRDGNNIKPPRNLIDLIAKAREAQIRAEERTPRELAENVNIIEADAIRRAQRALSEQRVQDTLLAEVAELVPTIEKFRDGKAEHNEASLSSLLGIPDGQIRAAIKPLIVMGFLEEIGGSFKIPMLYREGLQITQGKAFGDVDGEEE